MGAGDQIYRGQAAFDSGGRRGTAAGAWQAGDVFDIHSTKAKQFGFTMDLGNGEKFTCCGDEPYKECERAYVENSKWLLHEAFCLYGQADVFKPYEKHHSTVKDACELAEGLGVKNLVLYHTEDENIQNRKELYYEEGKQFFHGNLYIPEDLESLSLD